ncbi:MULTISPECIES: IclR family transcriptional regulator domain-containing protein [Streptomyces]|uniref:IclR family transcriptional regulator domain-containing protein n=1 Tax=Streptomyces erythrochromogenes TaxID=285574 RepID=UPI0036B7E258
MIRNDADAGSELDEALQDTQVFTDEYAFYDEDAARRRIAHRIAAARTSRALTAPRASDATLALPAAARPGSPADRKHVLDAASNVRAARTLDTMARALVDSPSFTRIALDAEAWPHSQPSALLYASLLHLSGRMEAAQFWFQYAAGAGSDTAARALYLLHLSRAEITTAHHWRNQPQGASPDLREELPPLPSLDTVEDTLHASIIWASPPVSTTEITPTPPTEPLLRNLPAPIRHALDATAPEDHEELGDIYTPTPRLASALARCARLDPAGLAAEAKPGARLARRSKRQQPVNTHLESAHRALRVLEVIHRHPEGVSRTQIARETGLPQLYLAHAIEHLVRTQLATPIAPRVYAAGTSLKLAENGRSGGALLRETLAFLRDAVGAAVYVASYTDGEISITQYADSPTAPAVHEWVDFREAAHASAVGKALLAQLHPDDRREHLDRHRMEAFTPHTITNPQVLFTELDTRPPGEPLLDLQEYALGTVCAAVPIPTGTEPECVALSLPTPDPHKLQQAARVLRNEAIAVLLALLVGGTTPTPPRETTAPHAVIHR